MVNFPHRPETRARSRTTTFRVTTLRATPHSHLTMCCRPPFAGLGRLPSPRVAASQSESSAVRAGPPAREAEPCAWSRHAGHRFTRSAGRVTPQSSRYGVRGFIHWLGHGFERAVALAHSNPPPCSGTGGSGRSRVSGPLPGDSSRWQGRRGCAGGCNGASRSAAGGVAGCRSWSRCGHDDVRRSGGTPGSLRQTRTRTAVRASRSVDRQRIGGSRLPRQQEWTTALRTSLCSRSQGRDREEALQTVGLNTGAPATHHTAGSRRDHTLKSREPGHALPRPRLPYSPSLLRSRGRRVLPALALLGRS